MAQRIQMRRGLAENWEQVNPTLAQGEFGLELDTSRLKIGDGVTSWNSLPYKFEINLPKGGAKGEVLVKSSEQDYDAKWVDLDSAYLSYEEI